MRSKRLIVAIMVMLLLSTAVSCGNKGEENNVKCSDALKTVLEKIDTTKIDTTTALGEELYDGNFETLYNIPIKDVDDGAIGFSSLGSYADEISIIRAADENSTSDIKAYMEKRLEQRLRDFQNYLPKEAGKVENGKVIVQRQYVILIIAKDVDDISNELRKIIG